MTTQSTSAQPQNVQPDAEAAAKIRRVLSVAEPKKAQDKTAPVNPAR